MNAHGHYELALQLRNRIIAGQSNETPVQAWAGVVRNCAIAASKFRAEVNQMTYTRAELAFLNNIDRIWQPAKAQVQTLTR